MKKITILLTTAAIMAATPFSVFAGEWKQDTTGYWYQNDDGTYPASSWKEINGQWYYFAADGYMNVGWVKVPDQWYYCEPSGEMRTSELSTDVFTFRFHTNGSCQNFYENTTPSADAGWAPYNTSSLSTLADNVLSGNVVYYNGSYWATPDYRDSLKKATAALAAYKREEAAAAKNYFDFSDIKWDSSDDADDTWETDNDWDFDDDWESNDSFDLDGV